MDRRREDFGKNLNTGVTRNRSTIDGTVCDGRFFRFEEFAEGRKEGIEEGRVRTEGVADFPSRYPVVVPSDPIAPTGPRSQLMKMNGSLG